MGYNYIYSEGRKSLKVVITASCMHNGSHNKINFNLYNNYYISLFDSINQSILTHSRSSTSLKFLRNFNMYMYSHTFHKYNYYDRCRNFKVLHH